MTIALIKMQPADQIHAASAVRIRKLVALFFTAIGCAFFSLFTISAHALPLPTDCIEDGGQTICEKPTASDWRYRACDENGADVYSRGYAWCTSNGGTYYGIYQGCIGGTAPDDSNIYPRAQAFANALHASCSGIDSGWGQSVTSNTCYSGSPVVNSGFVVEDYRRFSFTCSPSGSEVVTGNRSRMLVCPAGYSEKRVGSNLQCVRPAECCTVAGIGNPISPASGVKTQIETDYQHRSGLAFTRYYHSFRFKDPAAVGDASTSQLGSVWRSNYDRRIAAIPNSAYVSAALLTPTGRIQYFDKAGKEIIHLGSSKNSLIVSASGYVYQLADRTETYDLLGRLMVVTLLNGQSQTLSYSTAATPISIAPRAGFLISVTDNWGNQIRFTYDAQAHLISMIDPAAGIYQYAYDEASSFVSPGAKPTGNLTSVIYPDGKKRQYWYNEAAQTGNVNLPQALTGITDENGVRFASYTYDANGRGTVTEHAGGVERYSIAYTSGGAFQSSAQTTVIDPLGTSKTVGYQQITGVFKPISETQAPGAGSAAASSSINYDVNGNVATRVDFNGVVTTYQYDLNRQLEVRRVEAAGTPQARTISTEWHSVLRLPVRIADPKLQTLLTYDASGNLLTRTSQVTSDATGALAFSATSDGAPRTSTYTYNGIGQVLTMTGPRTDVVDKTTVTYDSMGSLATLTNPAGQVTKFTSYDANGRLLSMTDMNGAVMAMTYSSRSWLLSNTIQSADTTNTESTTYSYDGIGQMTRATFRDGNVISYTYDDAHRLTAVTDSAGNKITYTLDNMGNRTNEAVSDPGGVLARATTRVYDALNRLQQRTGGTQ